MARLSWFLVVVLGGVMPVGPVGLGCSSGDEADSTAQTGPDAGGAPDGSRPDAGGTPDGADVVDGTAGDGTVDADGTAPFVPDRGCRGAGDCSGGKSCGRFGATGPGICVDPVPVAEQCAGQGGDCCRSSECEQGTCVAVTTQPVQCSPTSGFDVRNRCVTDDCTDDSACPAGSVCTPAGFELRRSCIAAGCKSDADCTAEAGGACVLIALGCVGDACSDVTSGCCVSRIGGGARRDSEVACVYPRDGCQSDGDCGDGFCTVAGGRARCTSTCQ